MKTLCSYCLETVDPEYNAEEHDISCPTRKFNKMKILQNKMKELSNSYVKAINKKLYPYKGARKERLESFDSFNINLSNEMKKSD